MRKKLLRHGTDGPASPERRRFLGCSVAGGAGAALILSQAAQVTSAEPQSGWDCGRPSFSNSLLVYLRFIPLLLTEALIGIITQAEDELTRYSDAFAELYDKVKKLETEMCKTRPAAHVKQMSNMVESGRDRARMLKAAVFSTDREVEPLLFALTLVGEQVCSIAETLRGETSLNPTETEYLRQVLEAVNKPAFKKLRDSIAVVQKSFTTTGNNATGYVNSIEERMVSARRNIILAERPATPENDRPAFWKAAGDDLTKALEALRTLLLLKLNGRRVVSSRLPEDVVSGLPELLGDETPELKKLIEELRQEEKEAEKQDSDDDEKEAPEATSPLWPADVLTLLLSGVRVAVRAQVGIPTPTPTPTPAVSDAAGVRFVKTSAFVHRAVHASGAAHVNKQDCSANPEKPLLEEVKKLLDCYCPPGDPIEVTTCDALVRGIKYVPRNYLTIGVRRDAIKSALILANQANKVKLTPLACVGHKDLTSLARELEKLYV